MSYQYRKILLIILLFLMSSCTFYASSNTSERDDNFIKLYPNVEMNKTIQFLPPDKELRVSDRILLWFKNTSENIIVFPYGMNINIYSYFQNTDTWDEIENLVNYLPSDDYQIYYIVTI